MAALVLEGSGQSLVAVGAPLVFIASKRMRDRWLHMHIAVGPYPTLTPAPASVAL